MGIMSLLFRKNNVKPTPKPITRVVSIDMARQYASLRDRLYQDLSLTNTLADYDIRISLNDYRAAATSLVQNNAYAKRYLETVAMNIVGQTGFTLKVEAADYSPSQQTYTLDKIANDKIETAWYDWSKPKNLTPKGDISFRELLQVLVKSVAVDGEAFVQVLKGRGKYGLQLRLIPAILIDEAYNEAPINGNGGVVMGVELDGSGAPTAYYYKKPNLVASVYSGIATGARERIPADQIFHIYLKEYSIQTRGMTWLSSVIKPLKMLDGFEESAVVNARAAACKMGFIEKTGDAPQYTASENETDGSRYLDFAPGLIEELEIGQKFTGYDPKYPDAAYKDFVNAILKKIASGLSISYSTLTGDLTEVNYSSIRAGIVEERNMWRNRQAWLTENFLEKIYSIWLKMGITSGIINLPIQKLEKFDAPTFVGRTFDWVDPLKDVEADIKAMQYGLKTYTELLAERGKDTEEQLTIISKENELKAKYGVELGDPKNTQPDTPSPEDTTNMNTVSGSMN